MEIRAVEIEGEALCPCGSERKHMDCCASTGHRFGLLEYEGKRIFFDVDETQQRVDELVTFCSEKIFKRLHENEAIVEKEKALRYLKAIYELSDKALEPFLRNSSCEKGCNACCYLIVESAAIEAEMVSRYMEEHFDREKKLDVLAKIKEAKRYYPDPVGIDEEYPESVFEKHFALHVPCPFLSSEGSCMIYEVRPINCRKHTVFSDPRQCEIMADTASYEAEYFSEVDPAVHGLSALVYPKCNYDRHLPDWFVEEFDL
jgi:Fe-S-cluster containining protein